MGLGRHPRTSALAVAALVAFVGGLIGHAEFARAEEDLVAIEEARQLLRTTNAIAAGSAAMDLQVKLLEAMMVKLNPTQGPLIAKLTQDIVVPALKRQLPAMEEDFAKLYALHFSASELREINAFYATPVGRKAIEKLPMLMQQGMAMGQAMGAKAGREAAEEFLKAAKERGLKVPEKAS